ncbi:hypothetical protein AKJ41_00655 [candidate division MSBL1 archaeon SCGC-AAA259O05]|nr:hypothetical protein AKJ41_00655 [candidate division MSBL1 archaeon SCGC-AAA259O05]
MLLRMIFQAVSVIGIIGAIIIAVRTLNLTKESVDLAKGEYFDKPPLSVEYLIPSDRKYKLDWIEQTDRPQRPKSITLPPGKRKEVIFRFLPEERLTINRFWAGWKGRGEEIEYFDPFTDTLEGEDDLIVKRNWHNNILVEGEMVTTMSDVMVRGLRIETPAELGKYELRFEVEAKEARKNKVVFLPVEIRNQKQER